MEISFSYIDEQIMGLAMALCLLSTKPLAEPMLT